MAVNNFNPVVLISGNYNAFDEGWNSPGVYMCSGNYISETFKLPIYIGSSIDLQKRIEVDHIGSLNRGNHRHNKPLQFSWNKHNKEDGFIWFLLETCQPCETLILEQKYLDLYRPFIDEFGGFNIAHIGQKFSDKHKEKLSKAKLGRKLSQETIDKMIKSNTGKKRSQESKDRMSKSKLGTKLSKERVQKIIDDNSKNFIVIDPMGNTFKIKNLSKFCRENNLEVKNMSAVAHGISKSHKKWKCFKDF